MAKKKKDRNAGGEAKLEMTPMIDVVFQLLIFFIVTLKQEDILSQLDAMRPAPDTRSSAQNADEPVKIQIDANGLIYRGVPVSHDALAKSLATIARYNPKATIIINCLDTSKHKFLVQALDACSKNGLNNLAVFSL
jgi:biopolymer transport protein ExbD